jgi:hypothetical protein
VILADDVHQSLPGWLQLDNRFACSSMLSSDVLLSSFISLLSHFLIASMMFSLQT